MAEPTSRQKIGKLGEDIACKYLEKHNYKIAERNYWKKWGEIDIIAWQGNELHFVEVKTITRSLGVGPPNGDSGYRVDEDDYEAEDNVHPWKLKRLYRAMQTYILERKIDEDEHPWQLDLIVVTLDYDLRKARVRLLPDIF